MASTLTVQNPISTTPLSQRRAYSVAEVILEQLQLWGVQRIYGVVGDAIFGLLDSVANQNAVQFIAVKHESTAALMASAEAKLTGKLGVCAAQMGPGLANLINGLGDAFLDKAPVLAITGQAPLGKIGTAYKQYINQQELVQAIASYSQLLVHPDAVADVLTAAMYTSISKQTVSHLSIPADVFSMATANEPREPIRIVKPVFVSGEVEEALQLMRSANQPMIIIGNDARSAGDKIQQLAQRWGSGIAAGFGALGIVPDFVPSMLGGLGEGGNPYLTGLFRRADVVLAVGTSWWPNGAVPEQSHVIQIENEQSRLGTGLPVNVGIVGEAAHVLQQLNEGMSAHSINQDWVNRIGQCKQAWTEHNEKEGTEAIYPLHPSRIVRVIEQQIAEDAVVALDEGDSTIWFLRNFRTKRQSVLLSSKWRTMGFGLPAAIAAKLCSPQKQVVCITGDGGLGMVLADLLTATRYMLPITVIVFNNDTLQMEQDKMSMKGLQPEGTKLTNPDFAKVAEACGWKSYRIEHAKQLEEALKQSRCSNEPVLLDVLTAQIPHPDFKSH